MKIPQDRMHYVQDNMNFVYYLAHKIHIKYDNDYEDLLQEGMVGLCLAAIRFDESKGFQFSTFAATYIKGAMQRYRRDNNLVKQPRSVKDIAYRVNKYKAEHPEASDEEIRKELKISKDKYMDYLILSEYESLDRCIEGKDNSSIAVGYLIPDTSSFDKYFEELEEDMLIDIANKVTKDISQLHRDIYDDYFYSALFGEKMSQIELSKKYDVSQAHVSRIINDINKRVLAKYKKY